MDHEFIFEESNHRRIIIFISVVGAFITIVGLFSLWAFWGEAQTPWQKVSSLGSIVTNPQATDFFFVGFLTGLFFLPGPLELVFFNALRQGMTWWIGVIFVLSGFLLAQLFNYFFGRKFSFVAWQFIPRQKGYAAKRWVNKYGVYAIALLNLTPSLPSPMLTFMLGIAKYPFMRLFTLIIIANLIKYAVIIGIAWILF